MTLLSCWRDSFLSHCLFVRVHGTFTWFMLQYFVWERCVQFDDIPISLLSQLERPLLIQEVIQFVGHPCLHVNIVSVLYTLKLVFKINKQTCKAVHLHVIGTFF